MQMAPPPAELIAPPAPGTPSTIAVDTSNAALAAQGLPAPANAPRNNTRNTNGNAPRNTTRRVGFNAPANNASSGNGTVTVNKMGSGAEPAPSANVRVNVMKQGV